MTVHTLSPATTTAWAKHDRPSDSWLPLYQHMADSASVAGHLWDDWLPDSVRQQIAACFPDGESDARIAVRWLAASHDLGKCSPVFALQVPDLADVMHAAGLKMPRSIPEAERRQAPHSLISHFLLRNWLVERFDWARPVADTYAVIPGGHHGVPPSIASLNWLEARPRFMGESDSWRQAQLELAEYCADVSGADARLPDWSSSPLTTQVQVLVSAIVILSDWIASNPELFPYELAASPSGCVDQQSRTEAALSALALPGPWRAGPPLPVEALFTQRFKLPPGSSPRPIQWSAYEVAMTVPNPGLIIIEAGMGEGKTEAALAAAEVLAHRTGAGGCFIALPTMATSDAMFTRGHAWAQTLPTDDNSEPLSIYLAHSKARLNEEFTGLMDGNVRGVGVDECDDKSGPSEHLVLAHQWLYGRKKGVLADIVVGTIDQILFGALKTRHLALRHLALANKIVIIDEVHAVDTYMSTYLDRVVEWLGSYRIPTIVLSATLPSDRRRHLVEAYDRASIEPPAAAARKRPRYAQAANPSAAQPSNYANLSGDIGYPVITASTGSVPMVRVVPPSGRTIEVTVQTLADDDATLLSTLRALTVDGGCVAIIRNTVGRAQETKTLLDQAFPGEVTLAHSRFISIDRMSNEARLREMFGPDPSGTARPHRHFVVGTQVLEQSLDVDFDLMVTDLAPLDLLVQRMGRLHRHARPLGSRPQDLQVARCLVVGVEDWSATPITPVKASRYVYGDSTLLRSAAVLLSHLSVRGELVFPRDIAPLVQSAYGADLLPPKGWESAWAEAEAAAAVESQGKTERARHFLLDSPSRRSATSSIIGWVERGAGEADDSGQGRAQVRDAADGIEVIVVQRISGSLRALSWLTGHAGAPLETGTGIPAGLAKALATCTVRLPPLLTSPWLIDRVIADLESNGLAAWQDSAWLRGELVLVLDEDLNADIAGTTIEYDRELGLRVRTDTLGAVN